MAIEHDDWALDNDPASNLTMPYSRTNKTKGATEHFTLRVPTTYLRLITEYVEMRLVPYRTKSDLVNDAIAQFVNKIREDLKENSGIDLMRIEPFDTIFASLQVSRITENAAHRTEFMASIDGALQTATAESNIIGLQQILVILDSKLDHSPHDTPPSFTEGLENRAQKIRRILASSEPRVND